VPHYNTYYKLNCWSSLTTD